MWPAVGSLTLPSYVYDMPDNFTSDVLGKTPQWHSKMYNAEIEMHHFLLESSVRSLNPDAAQFFFVPIYATRHLHNERKGLGLEGAVDIRS